MKIRGHILKEINIYSNLGYGTFRDLWTQKGMMKNIKWSMETLPMLPNHMRLTVLNKTKSNIMR